MPNKLSVAMMEYERLFSNISVKGLRALINYHFNNRRDDEEQNK